MPTTKEWAHLVKPLVAKAGPPGLYPAPRLWAEGKEWEGFAANFSYGFLTEPGKCHPTQGAVAHPYDEVLVFAGTNLDDILALEAQVSIELGSEREEHLFDIPTVVCIPKGLPHGPVEVRKVGPQAVAHYHFGLAPEYQAELIPELSLPPQKTTGRKYAHLIHPLRTNRTPEDMAETHANDPGLADRIRTARAESGRGGDEARGVLHPRDVEGPGSADSMICMFGRDLNDFRFNFTWGFYSGTGDAGVEDGTEDRGHTHPEPEALIWVGLDSRDPNYLGAEIELALGPQLERHVFDTPTCVVCPGGFVHTPLIVRRVDDPYVFLIGLLAEEYLGRPG